MKTVMWGTNTSDVGKLDTRLLQEQPRRHSSYSHNRNMYIHGASFDLPSLSLGSQEGSFDAIVCRKARGINVQANSARTGKVVLNVRGHLYETFAKTLERFPKTLLGSFETRQEYFEKETQQYCFGCRDISSFNAILFYYQSNGILSRPADVDNRTFYEEIRFFQLEENVVKRFLASEGLPLTMIDEESQVHVPKGRIWKFLEHSSYTGFAKLFAVLSLIVIFLSVATFCAETLPQIRANPASKSSLESIEFACVGWFALEYLLRVAFAPDRKRFCLSPLGCIDLLSFAPFLLVKLMSALDVNTLLERICCFLPVLKSIRGVRVLKASRYVRGINVLGKTLHRSYKELLLLTLCVLMCSVFFAALIYLTDMSHQDRQIHSIPDGIWFVWISVTNVGYGDVVPVSPLGRLSASVCIVCGTIVISIPLPVIVRNFTTLYRLHKNRQKLHG